jgi:hypothetical protein
LAFKVKVTIAVYEMGAAASLSDYVNLNDEQKQIWKTKYEKLIHDGKTEDEAINELKQP